MVFTTGFMELFLPSGWAPVVVGKLTVFDDIAGKDRTVATDAETFVIHTAGTTDANAAFHVPVQ